MIAAIQNFVGANQAVLFSLLKVVVVVFFALLPMVAYSVMAERRISAWIQDRVGPNRVGVPFTKIRLWGLGQPLADGIKSFLKEDFTSPSVRNVFFGLPPSIPLFPGFLAVAVFPFGWTLSTKRMVIEYLAVRILYTLGVFALGFYGIVLVETPPA